VTFIPASLSHLPYRLLQQRESGVYVFLRNHDTAVPCEPLDFEGTNSTLP